MDPSQTPQAAQTQPGILQAIEDAAKAAYDNVKTRFSAGPPAGTLSAAPGSPLAQHDTTIQAAITPGKLHASGSVSGF